MTDDGPLEAPSHPIYYDDGHTISFQWVKDAITIGSVHCPHVGTVSVCNRGRHSCVVDTYLKVYGPELNIGDTWISEAVEIAWIPVEGDSEFDHEFCQVWIVPVDDENFQEVKALDAQFELEIPDSIEEDAEEDLPLPPED